MQTWCYKKNWLSGGIGTVLTTQLRSEEEENIIPTPRGKSKGRKVEPVNLKLLQNPPLGEKAFVTLIGAGDSAKQMKVIKGREMDGTQVIRLFCQRQIRFQKKPLSISRE